MVLIHMKRSEEHQFLFESTVTASVADVTRELAEIHNLRLRIHRLKYEGDELAQYGPIKPPDKQGLDEEMEGMSLAEKPEKFKKDPTGRRTGAAPVETAANTLRKTLEDAFQAVHKNQVEAKVPITKKLILEHLDLIRGAVLICFPQGLPEFDPVRMAIEDHEELEGTSAGLEVMDPATAQLWGPGGKCFQPEKKLSDYVGRNEKCKVVLKLQKRGAGAPAREPVISAEEQKNMMSYYHKKQEEMKKLAEASEDLSASSWADPKALKGAFAGVGNVRVVGSGARGFNQGVV